MELIWHGVLKAAELVFGLDGEVWSITWRSLQISGCATFISLLIGIMTVITSGLIGITLGVLGGFFGGRVDDVVDGLGSGVHRPFQHLGDVEGRLAQPHQPDDGAGLRDGRRAVR